MGEPDKTCLVGAEVERDGGEAVAAIRRIMASMRVQEDASDAVVGDAQQMETTSTTQTHKSRVHMPDDKDDVALATAPVPRTKSVPHTEQTKLAGASATPTTRSNTSGATLDDATESDPWYQKHFNSGVMSADESSSSET